MTVGFFGKVPARGDFVRRALPADFVTPWDQWLQAGIAGAQELLGDAWLEVYLTSPVWRFALSARLAGESAAAAGNIPTRQLAMSRYATARIGSERPGESGEICQNIVVFGEGAPGDRVGKPLVVE